MKDKRLVTITVDLNEISNDEMYFVSEWQRKNLLDSCKVLLDSTNKMSDTLDRMNKELEDKNNG